MAPCDSGYASLSLQFASKEDIALMMSPGARCVPGLVAFCVPPLEDGAASKVYPKRSNDDDLTAGINVPHGNGIVVSVH